MEVGISSGVRCPKWTLYAVWSWRTSQSISPSTRAKFTTSVVRPAKGSSIGTRRLTSTVPTGKWGVADASSGPSLAKGTRPEVERVMKLDSTEEGGRRVSRDDDAYPEDGDENESPSKEGRGRSSAQSLTKGEVRQQQLKVVGMHCATCVATVSKAIKSVDGVRRADVNLASGQAEVQVSQGKLKDVVEAIRKSGYDVLTEVALLRVSAAPEEASRVRSLLEGMEGVVRVGLNPVSGEARVEFNPFSTSPEEIAEKLKSAGYRAAVLGQKKEIPELEATKRELASLSRLLVVALVFTAPTLAFQYLGLVRLSLISSLPVQFYSGMVFHRGAWRALKNRTTNMDTLVSLSSNAAWFYSAYSALFGGKTFFDTALLLISFVLVGKTIEAYVRGRAVTSVAGLQAVKARKLVDEGGVEVERSVDSYDLSSGDLVALKSGDVVPADGVLEEGVLSVDESLLTGESEPVRKTKGDALVGGARVVSGYAKLYVTRSGERTYLAAVLNAVREAETARLPSQDLVDRVSAVFSPLIIGTSIAAFIFRVWVGTPVSVALLFSVAVLASACPCALGLATPMAVLTAVNRLAKKGITVKDGGKLEDLTKVRTFVFDKTGTLTTGSFAVKRAKELIPGALLMAAAVEALSSHPVASAVVSVTGEREKGQKETPFGPRPRDTRGIEGSGQRLPVEDFSEFPGEGVHGRVSGHEVLVGKRDFAEKNAVVPLNEEADLVVLVDWKPAAYLWVGDELREGVAEMVRRLKRDYAVVVATGDSSKSAEMLANSLGVSVMSGLSPEDKVNLIKELKAKGPVAFVGDGVNDAVALREADVGIAIASGTELAKYAGDILVRSPSSIPDLLAESRLSVRKVKENLAWAFGYNSILVPLAAGVFYPAVYLAPEFAALAMSMSSVFVSLWSLVRK